MESPETATAEKELANLRQAYNSLLAHAWTLEEANAQLANANQEARRIEEEMLLHQEEMQADDEQIRTLNEELQATNEEVETVNEELEATIEELNTTNEELLSRSQELQRLIVQREALQRESERERARLAAVLAHLAEAVLVVDAAGAPVAINKAYADLFEPVEGSVLALPVLYDLEGNRLEAAATPQARVRGDQPFQMEFMLPTEAGQQRWFEAQGRPVFDEEGNRVGGVVTLYEITDRTLRHLRERLSAQAAAEDPPDSDSDAGESTSPEAKGSASGE